MDATSDNKKLGYGTGIGAAVVPKIECKISDC